MHLLTTAPIKHLSSFIYIEICIKDKNNRPVNMKDFFQISVYIS